MTGSSIPRNIAILGAGKVGRPIGRHWLAAGHSVTFGSRDPGALASFVRPLGHRARAATLAEAADAGDIVFLSVPYPALEGLLDAVGDRLAGKIVIDATNPMGLSDDGHIISTLGPGVTEGGYVAKRLPDSRVARAFTHVMDELLWPRGTQQRDFWGMAFAADDPEVKSLVTGLIEDTGFVPVELGGLDDSAALDPGGSLFPNMFTPADLRRRAGIGG